MRNGGFQPDWFSRPGDTVAALMARHGLTPSLLAERLGCDRLAVRGLLAGTTGIDEVLADGLSQALGGTPHFWQRRQSAYERSLAQAADAVPKDRGATWLKKLPISDMASSGWINRPERRTEVLRSCLAYFGVTGPEEWEFRYATFSDDVAFRTSPSFESRLGAVSAWLRQAEIEAAMLPCGWWSSDGLRERLDSLRALARTKSLAYFLPRLRDACAAAGVAVVILRAPSGCRASGAARFIFPDRAMVVLSFRHLSDDHFWFTFFHEIGHLLLHGRSATFVDGEAASTDEREAEANWFAASLLIPENRQDELMSLRGRREFIQRFAVSVGVSPGIVVAQMQHHRVIGPDQLNFLKRRYTWPATQAAIV